MNRLALASLILLGAWSTPAAVTLTLSAAQVEQARAAGAAMNVTDAGYQLGTYLLRQFNADVILRPDSPEVDGVVLSTPFEKVQYEAYLSHLEAQPLSAAQATALARQVSNTLSFRVYTHSPFAVDEEGEQWQLAYRTTPVTPPTQRERSYLDFFRPATLQVGTRTFTATPVIDGPYVDNFTLPSGRATFRNLGVVTYAFRGANLPTTGQFTLAFQDSQGKAYRVTGDLARYR